MSTPWFVLIKKRKRIVCILSCEKELFLRWCFLRRHFRYTFLCSVLKQTFTEWSLSVTYHTQCFEYVTNFIRTVTVVLNIQMTFIINLNETIAAIVITNISQVLICYQAIKIQENDTYVDTNVRTVFAFYLISIIDNNDNI